MQRGSGAARRGMIGLVFGVIVVAAYVPDKGQIATYMNAYQAISRSLVTSILIPRKASQLQ